LKKVTEFGVGIGIGIEERAILAIVMKMGGWSDSVKEPRTVLAKLDFFLRK